MSESGRDPQDPMHPTLDAEPGDLLGHTVASYVVTDYLGSGGMGRVYLARHTRIGLEVALKVLHLEHAHDPKVVRRFEDEARAATRAGHRNIVQVFDFGELPDGRAYFVMERLKGRSLASALSLHGPFSPEHALAIAREIALALGAAHAAGVVHRDLKPDNVFMVDDGSGDITVKVLDFGIAKLQREARGGGVTEVGTVFGTPMYMSPEQAKGATEVDGRADLYALGIMLYEMVSGKVPFTGQPGEVLARHLLAEPPDLATLRPGLPSTLLEIVRRLLLKSPADRLASVSELVHAIDHAGLVPARVSTLQGFASSIEAAAAPGPAHAGAFGGTGSSPGGPPSKLVIRPASTGAATAPRGPADDPARAQPARSRDPSIPLGAWTDPDIGLDATFVPAPPAGGGLAAAPAHRPLSTPVRPTASDGELVARPPRARARPRSLVLGLTAGIGAGLAFTALLWIFSSRDDDASRAGPDRDTKPALAGDADEPPASAAPLGILVSSDPPGADVLVEGEPAARGRAPLVIPVAAGEPRTVRLTLADHAPATALLDAAGGEAVTVSLTPLPRPVAAAAATAAPRPPRRPPATKAGPARVKRDATLKPTF